MASGLSIVIDTRNAELNIKNLNQALERLENQGNSIANMMRNLGGANPFAGLTTSITSLKDGFNDFAVSTNTAKTAIKNLADGFTSAKTAIDNAEASLRQFNQTAGANGLGRLNGALTAANNSLNQTNNTIHNTQNNFTQLNNNVNLTRNSLTALSSVVTNNTTVINNYSRSAVSAAQSTAIFQRSAQGLEATLMRLQTLMTGGLFGMAALSVLKTADAMQTLDNQVRIVTKSTEERLAVENEVHRIANTNYTDIKTTTDIYHRNALAMASMGASQKDVLRFTDNMSLAMRTSGRTITEQNSALYQWSQAMGAGKLQGQEFRVIALAVPSLLKYISAEMGVTTGQLKKLGAEGKITGEVMVKAVEKARPELEKLASQMPMTMSQAFTVANNEYKLFIDKIMNGTGGASQTIASMIYGVGKNFDTVIKGMTIAGGLAFVAFASKIDIATKAMGLFNFVANANPFVRMATIILAVSSAFYGLDDVINTTSVIMGDLIHMITDGWTGIFNLIGDGLNSLQGVVAQNNDDIGKSYKDMFTNATTDHDKFIANATFASNNLVKTISTDNMKNEQSYFGFYSRTQKGFLGFVEFVGTAVITAVSTLGGFFKFVFTGIENTLNRMGNAIVTAQEWIDKKLGKAPTKYQRYEVNDLSAQQAFADVNTAGQKAWHDIIMGWADKINSKQPTVNGMPPSMDYKPPVQTPSSSDSDTKNKKKKDDLQIQVFNAWKNAGLSAQQAMLLTAEVGRENAYNAKVLFGYHKDANNGKLNVGMLSWQGSRATDLSKYLAAAGVLKNGKIEKSQESLNAMAQFAVKEMMSNPAYAKTKTVFLANKEIDTNSGFNVLGRDYIRWDMDGRKINANSHKTRRNNYYAQIQAKVGDKDLVSNFMEQTKAHDDYVNSIATGEAKIRAELAKTIESLPSKGFSGQALEDEKKRLTEEAEFDRLLSSETNRQKLDELMGVHKTKKDQILDEATLQRLTIQADESKSREQRKAELEALDVGTKEKIRLNDIANKYELGKIWAFRKTSSELIADEWDEKMDALREYTGEYKEEWRKAYEEQRKIALENDKLVNQQKLLDINVENLTDIDLINKRAELEQKILDNTPNISPEMYNAQSADIKRKQANGVFDVRKSANDGYMSTYFDLYGQKDKYEAYKGADDKRIAQNDAVQKALDAGIIQHEEYYQTLKDIDAQYVASKQAILVGGYQSIFGSMTSLMSAFGGEQSRAYRVLASIEKGYALYKAFLNNKTAILDAYATTPGAWYTKAAAAAKVAIDTGVMTAAISAITPQGFSTGGYTGNMGVNDIAGVVHGKEYVLNAAATKRIGVDNLNAMNKGASIGNNNVSVNVVVNADGSSDVQANAQMGKQMGDAIKAAVLQTIVQEKRQGGLLAR